jgi:hypothetical protein
MINGNPYQRKSGWGIPWSHAELAALEPYVRGRINKKYRNSRQAAQSYLADMEEDGIQSRRTLTAVWLRICRRVRGLEWEFTVGWSREERRVIDRHVRRLARADGMASSSEISACTRDLRRLRARHRGAAWAQVQRTRKSVAAMLNERARLLKRRWAGSDWTEEENRIVEPYAQDLARSHSTGSPAFARRCWQELEQLRRRDPGVAARRTPDMVLMHIRLRARALGWSGHWTAAELRILDTCVRTLSRGRFRSGTEAADAYLVRFMQRRKTDPDLRLARRRSRVTVAAAIYTRARKLDLPIPVIHLTGEVKERIEWYARQVARGRIPSARKAARQFLQERAGRDGSTSGNSVAGHDFPGFAAIIRRRARKLGRPPTVLPWGPEENAVIERYIRRLAAGDYTQVSKAARVCRAEIGNLHRQHPDAVWSRVERTLGAVRARMLLRLDALGARWAGASFTSEENRVFDRYARLLTEGRIPRLKPAVQQCARELELRHERFLAQHPELPRCPQPRTAGAICGRLCELSIQMGRARRRAIWTEPEAELARAWVPRCTGQVAGAEPLSVAEAARRLVEELRRKGHRRNFAGCCRAIVALSQGWQPGQPTPAIMRLARA